MDGEPRKKPGGTLGPKAIEGLERLLITLFSTQIWSRVRREVYLDEPVLREIHP